ncbi:MAG: bifunctional adenosylcobinamide kinase/adenosylcobinamide-phosphate guanylyltransferase [Oscillospiraceae bacterium]|nr:bifunctional adenosylcobinamide kinase/adenosylcobinamide-phosphate guanylyltransferase [Oscillospiraceae bacterium]
MAKIIFVTGGVQSGKARWAANYLAALDNVAYMCVYDSLESDIADRIAFNCSKRDISWEITENARDFAGLMKGHKFAILDNLGEYTNRVAREKSLNLNDITPEQRAEVEKQVVDEMIELIWEVKEIDGTLIILSVELGFCPVPSGAEQRAFRRMLGNINQRIANQASEVYLTVSGIPMKIK